MKSVEKTFWASRNLKAFGKTFINTTKSLDKSFDSRGHIRSP